MAWRCTGATNKELIDNLYNNGLITSPLVKSAMQRVDRANFAPSPGTAYEDSPQTIGHAATISAPHMHASATEALLPLLQPGARVLDVGSGSGYLTAVFAELVCAGGAPGRAVGLEHIAALKELGEANVRKGGRGEELLREGRMEFVVGDGRKGWVEEGGEEWDAIHVGAAAAEIHEALVQQLKRPGRMFIPVEGSSMSGQHVWMVNKDADGKVTKERLYGVRYVPLTDPPKW